MEGFLKQSTAVNITILMVDSTDHVTGKTGLTLTIYATKAAGTPAAITPTVTELDATNVKGVYKLALTTAHTDTLGELELHITATGADPADYKWQVSTYLPGEAATLQADQAVNVTKVNGTTQTARDLGASVIAASVTADVGITQAGADKVWATTTRALTDKVGFALSAAGVQAIWDALTSALTTAGSIGKRLADDIDATISSRTKPADTQAAVTTVTNLTNAPTAGDFTATMKTSLNAATPAVTVSDKTGFSLSAAGVQAIWDALTSALTTVGSIGKRLADDVDATVSSRSTYAGGAVASVTAGVTVTTNNDKAGYALTAGEHTSIASDAQTGLTNQGYTTARAGYLDTLNGLVQAIWDKATSALVTVGSVGKLLVDNVNATIASRSTYAGTDTPGTGTLLSRIVGTLAAGTHNPQSGDAFARLGAPAGASVSADIAAVQAKTVNLPLSPSAVSDIPTANANADALLDRANGIETGHTPRQALRVMFAVLAGKLSGAATTTIAIRDVGDLKNRVTATVDSSGNRTSVTLDET